MGMYDLVKYNTKCWKCKTAMKDFQTKDGPQVLAVLAPCVVQTFYGMCYKCKTWNEFRVKVLKYEIVRVKEEKKW